MAPFWFNPFQNDTILESSELNEFADNNFKFDENSRKFFNQVENTKGKGEIAFYKQFLHFPLGFQKTSTADKQNPGLVWERVNSLPKSKVVALTN